MNPEIRVLIDAPIQNPASANKDMLLVFYALPNGNTIEQTIGKVPNSADDWHYNIQHIGAQARFVRSLLPHKSVAIVYLENALQSWPAWRKKYGDELIPDVISSVKEIFTTNNVQVVLTSHSGGGSFVFGTLTPRKQFLMILSGLHFWTATMRMIARWDIKISSSSG